VFVVPTVFDVLTLCMHVSAGAAAAQGPASADLSAVRRDMSGRAGAVHLMMQLHSLPASMAHDSFDMHTAYLVPGSRAVAPEDVGADGVGTVLMWSSFNLALNWYRAYNWYRKENLGVVFGADHTYKFDAQGTAHLTLNMIAPDQSGHRLAFGPVGSQNNATTKYAMQIVRDHCQEILRLYSCLNLSI
jgi:hypothetical protein